MKMTKDEDDATGKKWLLEEMFRRVAKDAAKELSMSAAEGCVALKELWIHGHIDLEVDGDHIGLVQSLRSQKECDALFLERSTLLASGAH
jgi:hypothetical protein